MELVGSSLGDGGVDGDGVGVVLDGGFEVAFLLLKSDDVGVDAFLLVVV